MIVADSAVVHNKFGNVAALTNGVTLRVRESGVLTNVFADVKTSGQLIAQSGIFTAYGDAATSFELTNWTANDDAHTIVIDVGSLLPGGIRIGQATLDRFELLVNDDLTGLTEFTVRVMGYSHHAVNGQVQ